MNRAARNAINIGRAIGAILGFLKGHMGAVSEMAGGCGRQANRKGCVLTAITRQVVGNEEEIRVSVTVVGQMQRCV